MSVKYWWHNRYAREVQGAAGERVTFSTRRLAPVGELEAIADALNALPEYQAAAESPAPLVVS